MIRKAIKDDLHRIIEITKACAVFMISNNIFQWNEHYPNIETFENDALNENLYVLEINKKLIGCLVISHEMDEFYMKVKWQTPNHNNIYLHRLAVDPSYQKKGYAKQLMNFSFEYAKVNSIKSIRLDTFSGNLFNNIFYSNLGFKKLGKIYFRKQSDKPFYCFEKVM
ncbi:MAG: GNAT family N-acetyltransferase [Flavobacteriaceae bacterium]|nr:GNAT family N-acetyltransferase [Flavobacteriaceae bacterium]